MWSTDAFAMKRCIRKSKGTLPGVFQVVENFKVMDATKSMDRKEEGKEEEMGRKEGGKGGKGERKVLGGVWDGHVCLPLSDDG